MVVLVDECYFDVVFFGEDFGGVDFGEFVVEYDDGFYVDVFRRKSLGVVCCIVSVCLGWWMFLGYWCCYFVVFVVIGFLVSIFVFLRKCDWYDVSFRLVRREYGDWSLCCVVCW